MGKFEGWAESLDMYATTPQAPIQMSSMSNLFAHYADVVKSSSVPLAIDLTQHTVKELHAILTQLMKKCPEIETYKISGLSALSIVESISMDVDSNTEHIYFVVV